MRAQAGIGAPLVQMTASGSLPAKLDHGLKYVSDTAPGFSRRPFRNGFRFFDQHGTQIRHRATIDRLRLLVIPPAWTDVWISPDERGHLQATGRDAKGRKQYIYHPDFRRARESSKYQHLISFAGVLPLLRARIKRDMKRKNLDLLKVSATVAFLLEETLIRVGNDEYARANRSYGITTLRNAHAEVTGAAVKFKFRGKSGKMWDVKLASRRAANIIRACQELPGQLLFQYETPDGSLAAVTSTDINQYLREATGKDITAKDYRTWAGTVLAARLLHEDTDGMAQPQKMLREVIKQVAAQLGNTPTICRKCYIHPHIQELFLAGTLNLQPRSSKSENKLDPFERAVLSLLKKAEKTVGRT